MKLIITGGRQSDSPLSYFNKEWNNGILGVIYEYDTIKKTIKKKIEYETPKKFRPSKNYSMSFKSGSIYDNKLFITSLTEILIYDLLQYKLINRISLNVFNDLHHVIYVKNDLFIVITGLDLVVRYSLKQNKILTYYNCFPEKDTWKRFDINKDYRKINTTKPHFSHPNHVTFFDNKLFVTRYKQQDVLIFSKQGKILDKIDLNEGIPHDGSVFNNNFIYTSVNGKIIKVNSIDFNKKNVINLNKFEKDGNSLGWCRGFYQSNSHNYVGFSRIRPTKFIENIKWLGNKLTDKIKLKMPTRIVIYNRDFSKIIETINLEKIGINWIFSILKV
ncbi:MAG: hypothetical protein VX499_03655 [Bacteroidota bacterium]|nr:hypothetical protein [Bacteroidota bacterium]